MASVKELPHSLEAEQSILGGMLVYPHVVSIVSDQGLLADDFYLDIHQRIYHAMQDIIDSHKPIDVTTLTTRLQDKDELSLAGGIDYIIKLSDTAISPANSLHYIELIKERAHLRRLIYTAQEIVENGYDASVGIDEVLDKAERDILKVTRDRRATDFKSSRMVISEVLSELIRLRNADSHVTGIKTGYLDLDRITNGFQRGDLIILAARPAMGKTAFALNLALNASFYNSGAIAIFSLEMPAEQLMKRILSAKSSVEGNKLRSGYLSNDEFNRINEAANELMAGKLFVDDSSNIRIADIYSKCRKLKSEHGLDLVVIDYLQLISGSSRYAGQRQQEIAEISRALKTMAMELEIPVIALAQLSRSVETRDDKRPILSDLRESGSIEQDADIVAFLYRDDYYNKEARTEDNNSISELIIGKHRNGPTATIELLFKKNTSTFLNLRKDRENVEG
jgi:replicative DNA helicase